MSTLILRLIFILLSTSMLLTSASLPLQAFSLFIMRVTIASLSGRALSPLIGIYIVLIYSRGLLVLLAYFVALSPNQALNPPHINLLLFIIFSIFIFSSQRFFTSSQSQVTSSTRSFSNILSILNPSALSLLLIIGVILILTIVVVVKTLRLRRKPMRPWDS